jgi:hypothetical protein
MASFALAALASAVAARQARAESPVELVIHDGLVWLVSHDATTQAILAEWARVGQTTIIDADRAPDTRVTLELRGVSEQQALEVLLRSASGFVARQRADAPQAGHQSRFDRIVVLPFSQVPIALASDRSPTPESAEQKPTAVVGASMPPGFSPPPQAPPRRLSPAPVSPPAPAPQVAPASQVAPAPQPPKAPDGVPVPGMIVPVPQPLGPQPRRPQ